MEDYYYQQLNKYDRQVYHSMLKGLEGLEASFPVPRETPEILSDIFFKLRLDHPEIFYVSGFSYRAYPDADQVLLSPDYLFKKKQIQEHQKAIEARLKRLTASMLSADDAKKEQYIHDFICSSVTYDKLKKQYSHEIIGPLTQGVGVCEGIAKTVKILCDRLGIHCMIAISEAAPEKGIRYRHAWNVLQLGGTYTHLDATFDNSLQRNGVIRYDYYNITDTQIFRDHQPPITPLPACTDSRISWYAKNKQILTKPEDVANRVSQAARKGKDYVFQWRGSYLTREVLQQLCSQIDAGAEAKGKCAAIGLNWPQAVFQVSFAQERPAQVELQEADEGNSEAE
ncbi:MAG: peptidase [Oscillospiraceae bacterium]|nr:peptidase [Oscillospiraceae bacterium]